MYSLSNKISIVNNVNKNKPNDALSPEINTIIIDKKEINE